MRVVHCRSGHGTRPALIAKVGCHPSDWLSGRLSAPRLSDEVWVSGAGRLGDERRLDLVGLSSVGGFQPTVGELGPNVRLDVFVEPTRPRRCRGDGFPGEGRENEPLEDVYAELVLWSAPHAMRVPPVLKSCHPGFRIVAERFDPLSSERAAGDAGVDERTFTVIV